MHPNYKQYIKYSLVLHLVLFGIAIHHLVVEECFALLAQITRTQALLELARFEGQWLYRKDQLAHNIMCIDGSLFYLEPPRQRYRILSKRWTCRIEHKNHQSYLESGKLILTYANESFDYSFTQSFYLEDLPSIKIRSP